MIEIKQEFSRRERLLFGPLFALFAGIIATLINHRFGASTLAFWIGVAATGLIAVYYAVPKWQVAIYRGWMYSVAPIGWLVSHVLLSLLYYLLITPIGVVMRLTGYDPLQRQRKQTESYWQVRKPAPEAARYFRQY